MLLQKQNLNCILLPCIMAETHKLKWNPTLTAKWDAYSLPFSFLPLFSLESQNQRRGGKSLTQIAVWAKPTGSMLLLYMGWGERWWARLKRAANHHVWELLSGVLSLNILWVGGRRSPTVKTEHKSRCAPTRKLSRRRSRSSGAALLNTHHKWRGCP